MISKADIKEIRERKAVPDSPVLSVYLDVEQSKASNLNRHFEVPLKDMLRSVEAQLDKKQLKSFSADAERVQQFVSSFEPKGKGLIIFCDDSENFWWASGINASVRNNVRWSDTPTFCHCLKYSTSTSVTASSSLTGLTHGCSPSLWVRLKTIVRRWPLTKSSTSILPGPIIYFHRKVPAQSRYARTLVSQTRGGDA